MTDHWLIELIKREEAANMPSGEIKPVGTRARSIRSRRMPFRIALAGLFITLAFIAWISFR
jgi:hypothetical protein